jgi:general secretion pathway protein B
MSFILDALRKSETARRRSEAPDLFATMPAATEPARARPAWPLWAVGIVGTLSLLLALWLFSQRTPVPEPTPTASEAASEVEIEADPPTFTPMPAATRTPSPAPPAPVRNIATAEPPAPPVPVPADTTPSTVPARAPENANVPPTLREPPIAPSQVPSTPPNAPPAGDQPLALADLDPATRKQLPPLKLSMHLWNETASQRFVILDGQRLKEGDALGEIVVERISRDGAVLAWRGSRLKIELH